MSVKFNERYAEGFFSANALKGLEPHVKAAHQQLLDKSGLGSDFLGWINLPFDYDKEEFVRIKAAAQKIKEDSDILIVIGIGGSYLGARAAIEFLKSPYYNNLRGDNPEIYFTGNSISGSALNDILKICEGKRVSVNIISKSGTTTEPALAFRLLKTQLEEQQGKEAAKQLIVCITDAKKGALRTLATQEGYKTYVIEDNIGGRFSVLSPVGLLPIACAGLDIKALIDGAERMMEVCGIHTPLEENPAAQYAAARNYLYGEQGKKIEMLVNYHPKLHNVSEWWKQLYGESEGKENKGIFPASVDFTTDLHSMGQYIQEGERHLFETVISVEQANHTVPFPHDEANLDGLNFLAGKRVDEVNKMAELGTMIAHIDGGVPNMKITLPCLNEYYIGQLLYFFERACGISGYILGVNPFNQPGVEAYKKNMFALLDKPGYEAESAAIKARL